MPLILSHVSFAFPDQPPLFENVTGTVEPGECVAIIGANGVGKSTLLSLLLEDLAPTMGRLENSLHPRAALLNPASDAGLSWGQAAWRQLSALLVQSPRLLILDEPTRHLDYRHRQQLAEWIRRLQDTAVVVVSHDLGFLDQIATQTWHVIRGRVETARLSPSVYLQEREQAQGAYARRYRQQQEMIQRLEQDIHHTKEQARHTERHNIDSTQRRYAKKVAKKARSREKRLEHWKQSGEMLEAPRDAHVLRYTWDHVPVGQGPLCRIEEGAVGYQKPVLRGLFLEVRAGDRIGIVGDNGSGKSSLLQALLGRFDGQVSGYVRTPQNPAGYVRQVFDGDRSQTVWQYFRQRSSLGEGYGRAWLQSYGFTADHLARPVTALSQGEQVKLQIAALSAAGLALMALDEPEHHLDWPSLETVCRGLEQYPGTLLVISHQPYFLERLGMTTRWRIAGGTVTVEPWS